jgi:hypothetical protein
MEKQADRVIADLRDYGFVPDRVRALNEWHPPLSVVVQEQLNARRTN